VSTAANSSGCIKEPAGYPRKRRGFPYQDATRPTAIAVTVTTPTGAPKFNANKTEMAGCATSRARIGVLVDEADANPITSSRKTAAR
jgi:hypothetical protein